MGQTFKSQGKLSNGWTDWHKLWFRSADSSGNGHRLNTSRPSIPRGHVGGGGGVRGSHLKKSSEAVKRLDRLAPDLVHICGFISEWTQAKNNSPHDTPGRYFGWFHGVNKSKDWEMWSNGWTDENQFCVMQMNPGMDTG